MDKIKNILLGLIGIGATIITALFYRQKAITEAVKRESIEQELEDEKAATEQANLATEAMVRGIEDENTEEHDNRSYKFGDN